jgi:hypothetical protein
MDARSTAEALLAARGITVQVGGALFPPGEATLDGILAAIEPENRRARLAGLPDELNPIVLDPARARAFLEGLPRLPEAALAGLAGRHLHLGTEGLGLSTSSPIEPEAIARGFALSLSEGDAGRVVQPELAAEVHPERARELATRARAEVEARDREVAEIQRERARPGLSGEEQGLLLGARTRAAWRRFAAAKVWETSSRALSALDPGDRAAAADAREAGLAVDRFVTPPWTGMGGEDPR